MGFNKKDGFKYEECNMFKIKKNALNLQGQQFGLTESHMQGAMGQKSFCGLNWASAAISDPCTDKAGELAL